MGKLRLWKRAARLDATSSEPAWPLRDPGDGGTTLPHEHVLDDFIGAADITPLRYNRDEVFAEGG